MTALDPTAFEARLREYARERAEEGRAVRVGEKETSEQAAIVARYGDLFTEAQLLCSRGSPRATSASRGSG